MKTLFCAPSQSPIPTWSRIDPVERSAPPSGVLFLRRLYQCRCQAEIRLQSTISLISISAILGVD